MELTRDIVQQRCKSIYYDQKRRAARVFQQLDYGHAQLTELVKHALRQVVCRYCGGCLTELNFSVDHDRAVSRSADFRLANLVVVCQRCNQVKGSLYGEEFERLLAVIHQLPPAAQNDVLTRLRAGGKIRAGRWS